MSDLDLAQNLVRIGKFIVLSTMGYIVMVVVLAWLNDRNGDPR